MRQHAGYARFAWNWGFGAWQRYMTASHLIVLENPRPLKRVLAKLRRLQRRIARSVELYGKNRQSKRRKRRYAELRRRHLRIANLRLDAAHKATTAIAKRSRLVCAESLHVAGWMRNRRLSRSTADASPSRFLSLLKWKCEREGARLVEVDRFYRIAARRARRAVL